MKNEGFKPSKYGLYITPKNEGNVGSHGIYPCFFYINSSFHHKFNMIPIPIRQGVAPTTIVINGVSDMGPPINGRK